MRDFLEEFFHDHLVPILAFVGIVILGCLTALGVFGGLFIIGAAIAHGTPVHILTGTVVIALGIVSAGLISYMTDL